MNRILTLAGAVLAAAALTACSPGINTLGNSITFDANGIVVHAAGQPDARIGRDGELRIEGKSIAVTPAQRELLQRYYQQAVITMDAGKAMGEHGISMAARGVGDALASIFHSDSATANARMQAESKHIEAAAAKLCADVKALGDTQNAIATSIPAFAPYASRDRMTCSVTRGSGA